ncbi:unnamed protein product [Cutaneotrichosporon oleaginosum]
MPYIPPPQRVDLNALPPSLLVFPRDDYTHGAYRTPCGPFVDPTHVVLAAAARRATRVWRTALSSGDWRRVDTQTFNEDSSVASHGPLSDTSTTGGLLSAISRRAYTTLLARKRRGHPRVPLSSAVLMDWFYFSGDSIVYRYPYPKKIDLPAIVGPFSPDLERSVLKSHCEQPGDGPLRLCRRQQRRPRAGLGTMMEQLKIEP